MESWGNLVILPKPSALEQAQQVSSIKYTAPLQSQSQSQSQSSISPAPERTINILESRGLILSGGTTGNRTWEAALHLGSFLSTPAGKALVHEKRVIELGAGTGFLSLFCARHLGVKGVVATDREPFLIENMRACARLNRADGDKDIPFYPAIWDWGTPLAQTEEMGSMTGGRGLEFDVALGADLVFPHFHSTSFLALPNIKVLFFWKGERPAPLARHAVSVSSGTPTYSAVWGGPISGSCVVSVIPTTSFGFL
jgi:Predicted methyltransferase